MRGPIPHRGMTGRQIRWGTVGRAAAVVAAAIAGIVSLPALLGSDAPPPVPPDVGLTPPVASAPMSPVPSAPVRPRAGHRLARHRQRRERSRDRRERSHPRPEHPHGRRPDHRRNGDSTAAGPSGPIVTAPPVYSYVPPPSSEAFGIER